jgi:hypothetical protein
MLFDFHSLPIQKPVRTEWNWVMLGLILVLLGLKFHLIFLQNVNWDEFVFLAKVHAALRGELPSALQTGYVHAFTWLPHISANEMDQVIAARAVMLVLQAGTCGFIFAVGRKLFGSPAAAVVGVLAYLTFSYTIDHGTSFRADPIAVFLLMAALWFLVRNRGGWLEIACAGVLAALAGMVTIKSVLYVPTLGLAVLFLRGNQYTPQRVVEFFIFGASALMAFLALYAMHRYSLDAAKSYSAMSTVVKSSDKVFLGNQIFPRSAFIEGSLSRDPLTWLLLLDGFAAATGTALSQKNRTRGIGFVGMGLPLVTLVFYRNAYPYYYVFALAAPAVLVTGIIALAEKRIGDAGGKYFRGIFIALVILLSGSMIERYARENVDHTLAQRQIIDTVHRMFPQPVPYIDRSSMIPSFPKVGFFMSTWGIESYLESGHPIMRDLLVEKAPVFLIANINSLILNHPYYPGRYSLMPEDFDVLRDNFIPHWGAIWVAGKKLDLVMDGADYPFEILVPGTYTIEGSASVVIDGIEHVPGTSIELKSGPHSALSHHAPESITLRWGTNLYRPAHAPVSAPIFMPFGGTR